jgi:6-phosphogluconolactonase/glucosamine-6-phosphate isomerase/deaminase
MLRNVNILEEPFYKNIANKIIKKLNIKKNQNIILTGGSTFSKIYPFIKNYLPTCNKYYLTDERINADIKKTNYFNLKKNLINKKNINNFYFINSSPKKIDCECNRYSKIIPNKIDLILLSLGVGGHIASIFKKKQTPKKNLQRVIYLKKNKIRESRISINFPVINSAKNIFLVLDGKNKIEIFKHYINNTRKNYPVFGIKNKNTDIFISKNAYNLINKL